VNAYDDTRLATEKVSGLFMDKKDERAVVRLIVPDSHDPFTKGMREAVLPLMKNACERSACSILVSYCCVL